MSMIADKSFIGKGEPFLYPYAGGSAGVSLGNCSTVKLGQEKEEKSVMDYTSAGGGKANSISRVTSLPIEIVMYDRNAYNMALAVLGAASAITAAAVANEPHIAYKGGLVLFDFMPDTSLTITVTDVAGTTTYVEGTDYVVNNAGVYVTTGSTIPNSVASAVNLHVDYTKKDCNEVQALTQTAAEYKMVVSGLNEAQSGAASIVIVHRFKPAAANEISFIGDDYDPLTIPGEMLSDSSIVTAGKSKFWMYKAA